LENMSLGRSRPTAEHFNISYTTLRLILRVF